jgi:hypothetical protein
MCPALITAVVRAGTKLDVYDGGNESLNEIAADQIVKAGALIHHLKIRRT